MELVYDNFDVRRTCTCTACPNEALNVQQAFVAVIASYSDSSRSVRRGNLRQQLNSRTLPGPINYLRRFRSIGRGVLSPILDVGSTGLRDWRHDPAFEKTSGCREDSLARVRVDGEAKP